MKKKIWIMNHYATNSYYNKGGRHYWFAKYLKMKSYDPVIFCANTRHSSEDKIKIKRWQKFKIEKTEYCPFIFVKTTPSSGNGLDRIKNMVYFYINLFKAAKEYIKIDGKPDIIIASSVHPLTMVAGIKIAKKLNVPCICEIRDLWPEAIFAFNKVKERSMLGRLLTAGEYWIYRNADALIFTKEGDTDYIKEKKWDTEHGGKIDLKKCYYINNGVDLDTFGITSSTKIEDKDLNAKKFNVTYVGTIRPINNVGNILDAAVLLKDEEDIQFLIYGDGNQREMLEKRIADEKLENVKMKGFVDKEFIPYILSKSTVNILNYSQTHYNWTRGNSSNKLFEYMASGKPIISTVKMGYSIINKYNCGIELDESTSKDLATAILRVKKMSKAQYNNMAQNAKNGAKDFDFKNLTQKLINVINNVDRNNESVTSTK